jgi:hypothetical protein
MIRSKIIFIFIKLHIEFIHKSLQLKKILIIKKKNTN